MARKVSPFAELTHGEQQIRWLEYQSIRLPYNAAETEGKHSAASGGAQTTAGDTPPPSEPPARQVSSGVTPPPEVFCRSGSASVQNVQPQGTAALSPVPQNARMEQKTRHRQYDAVIEKMKQAERKAGGYQAWSK